jgi:murein L,D-transpeptidase YafK
MKPNMSFFFFTFITIGLVVYYFMPDASLPKGAVIDKLLILKSQRKLIAFSQGKPLKTYKIALGANPTGHKQFEGDRKTPEGIYFVDGKNAKSSFYKNLGISYPNEDDKTYAQSQGKSPGGLIKIHGLRNGRGFIGKFHRWKDWTQGCIAVTNQEMEELYQHTPIGTPIEILP